jgi:hypothetical protein
MTRPGRLYPLASWRASKSRRGWPHAHNRSSHGSHHARHERTGVDATDRTHGVLDGGEGMDATGHGVQSRPAPRYGHLDVPRRL